MSVETSRRNHAGTGARRVRRAVVALGVATLLTAVCAPGAHASTDPNWAPPGSFDPPPAGGFTSSSSPSYSTSSTSGSTTMAAAAVSPATEIAAIKTLKANYFRYVDTKNWSALRTLLHPLVVVDTTLSAGPLFLGRDPFIAFLQLTLGQAVTEHKGYNPVINLTSATTATGTWTMEDILIFGGQLGIHGYGRYQDRYAKINGQWVITYSQLSRSRLDLIDPNNRTVIRANVPLTEVAALVNAFLGI